MSLRPVWATFYCLDKETTNTTNFHFLTAQKMLIGPKSQRKGRIIFTCPFFKEKYELYLEKLYCREKWSWHLKCNCGFNSVTGKDAFSGPTGSTSPQKTKYARQFSFIFFRVHEYTHPII